jgi:hypothetical protein
VLAVAVEELFLELLALEDLVAAVLVVLVILLDLQLLAQQILEAAAEVLVEITLVLEEMVVPVSSSLLIQLDKYPSISTI